MKSPWISVAGFQQNSLDLQPDCARVPGPHLQDQPVFCSNPVTHTQKPAHSFPLKFIPTWILHLSVPSREII